MKRIKPIAIGAAWLVVSSALAAQGSYVPHRVYETARTGFADFEMLVADTAKADVVFLGEQHDDALTHRLQLAVLEGLARRRGDVVLSLEMFERDVQEGLDHFAMGHASESEFLTASRPWPRYATDYKPLVDFAIAHSWPVVAANVPRALASEVSKAGWSALDEKPDGTRTLIARERQCPTGTDPYYTRFLAAMGSHPGATGDNYYFAQCLKDETMAESIATAHAASAVGGKRPLVVHVNGAFHSDFGLGTAERVRRRMPSARMVVISFQPVENLDTVAPTDEDRKRGDYLVFTLRK